MGSEDERVKALFAAALEKPSEERTAWLVRVCGGDTALRARVETLLDAHERAGGFMEDARPASPADVVPTAPEEQPGTVIGRYKLLQKIGEGGFGAVYMAEQVEPVLRRVALKVIKLGMDTKQVVARFEAERQALAMMDHPNIAKVLDAGATASGRPYFVMELVRGVPITEYCDKANLLTSQRLELFVQVCGALQHAHQKGVIHRDVKPGNVLVTLHDGHPVPKVIDFGIAKATDRRLTEKTLFTEFRQVIGTPEYMSPEQAENSGVDIDTRSDVYSLGVLLYELLTATTPFDAASLREKGFGEMLRVIREDDPPPPSTRVSTLGDRLTAVARLHGVAPELFSRRLRGDLDWIVMKCLEKDRTRRYETASGLAADVRRHLNDEPVTAGPPGAGYRLRKFVRRNRAQVVAAGVVLAVLVLGAVGTTMGMVRALREKERADEEAARAISSARAEESARFAAQENEQKAVAETTRAEAAKEEEAKARRRAETISHFVTTALKSSDPENAGGAQAMTILAAMDNAVADIDSGRFADDPAVEAELRVTIGAILRNNGRLREAEVVLTKALETVRRIDGSNLAVAMNELALVKSELGRKEEARQLLVAALERDQQYFHGDHVAVSRGLSNLANMLPPQEAEPLIRRALAMDRRLFSGDNDAVCADLGNLASKLMEMGRTAEAEPLFVETLAMTQRLHPGDFPYVAKALDNLGKARHSLGRTTEAVDLLTQALAMRRRLFKGPHPDLATGLGNLALLKLEQGRLDEADRLYAEALDVRQRLFEGDNSDSAMSLSTLAGVRHEQGRLAESEPLFVRALEMRRRLAHGDDPGVADNLRRIASVRLEMGRPAEAEPLCVQALEMYRRLYPGDHPEIVTSLTDLGSALAAQGRSAEAAPLLVQAKEMQQRLPPSDDTPTAIRLDNLGKAFQRADRLADAEAMLAQALAMRERIYKGDNADLAKGLNNLAGALAARGRNAEAATMQRRALEMYERLFGRDDPRLTQALDNLAVFLRDAGRPAEAEPYSAKAVELSQRFSVGDSPRVALVYFNLATIREMLGQREEAAALFEKAMNMMERLMPAEHPDVLMSKERFAEACYWLGQYDRAIPQYESVLKVRQARQGPRHPDTLRTMADLGANLRSGGRIAEAIPLLEEVLRESHGNPRLVGVASSHLLSAYCAMADANDPKSVAQAAARGAETIAKLRPMCSEIDVGRFLTVLALELVRLKAWEKAEALVRESLEIRQKLQPNEWTTFNTVSVLGDVLLGQRKHAEAEPLLLAGYRGMKARGVGADPNTRFRLVEAAQRLVRLYEATANVSEAAAWRKDLEALQAADGRQAMSDPSAATTGEQSGDSIGRYKLLEQIGEGGMGSVWMAEQREPVKRRVALKIIKLGMDTRQVIARFEAERQALALMDHPHIAKVLDAGSTETGRPYFVMEYIKGVPIVEYCDQERLDTRSRLELFTSVCQAIQHAHHKGIIHRDIKPSNVLVTLHDGVPVPKVIDFGIAKATSFELTTKTLFTEHRQMLGTPAYMSPEQAEMSGLDIDTRSDVYSLGVLLYELLTGTTPFDIKTLLESGFGEMMRAIREDEPHKPSTRISSLGDTGARTAQQRRVELKKLSLLLRGDLDWIVMKCLEKDRTRRYETANGLAADIRRHLFDEPVMASPPGAAYRLRKFVRRNKAQVIAGCAVAVVLVLGVTGTTAGMIWASDEAERAEDEKTKATLAAENEAKAKARAQENEQTAVEQAKAANAAKEEEARARRRAETISGFVTTALRASDPENAGGGQGMTILAAMDNAIADICSGRFADDPAVEAGLKGVIGQILHNNGRTQEAEALLTSALETERRLTDGDSEALSVALNNLALVVGQLGRKEEARRLFEKALEMSRRLHSGDDPGVAVCMNNLAVALSPEEAEPLLRQALAMNRRLFQGDSRAVAADLNALAGTLQALGRTTEAESLFAEALEMSRRVYRGDHPALAAALDNLGKVRVTLGHPAEGTKLLEEALAMRRRMFNGPHPDLAKGLHNLAAVLKEQGRWAEAEPLSAELLEMQRKLSPGDDARVAEQLSKLAAVRRELGRWADAEPLYSEALQMRQRLYKGDHPDIAATLTDLGCAQAEQGHSAEAEPHLVQAMEMYRRLELLDAPATAKTLDNLGKALQRAGRAADAEALLARALAMRERLYKGDDPDLATGLNNLASAQLAGRRFAEAEATQRRALAMCRRLHPGDHQVLALALQNLAIILRDAGRAGEAEPLELQAVEVYQRVFPGGNAEVALALYTLGTIREAAGRFADAVPPHEAGLEMVRKVLPADHADVLASMTTLARVYYMIGRFEKAIPLYEEAVRTREAKLGRQHPLTLSAIGNLGANYKMAGRIEEAVPLLEEAWKASKQHPELTFVDRHLLDAYVRVADPAKEGTTARAMALFDELLAEIRAKLPKESPALARELTTFSAWLLGLKAWDKAEALLREALAIREKTQPDVWTTFNSRSVLGDALLGQKRYAEAEPLLLKGYRGMKEREATIDPGGRVRIPQALERLVRLYEATGDTSAAASWRRELEAATSGPPSPPGK